VRSSCRPSKKRLPLSKPTQRSTPEFEVKSVVRSSVTSLTRFSTSRSLTQPLFSDASTRSVTRGVGIHGGKPKPPVLNRPARHPARPTRRAARPEHQDIGVEQRDEHESSTRVSRPSHRPWKPAPYHRPPPTTSHPRRFPQRHTSPTASERSFETSCPPATGRSSQPRCCPCRTLPLSPWMPFGRQRHDRVVRPPQLCRRLPQRPCQAAHKTRSPRKGQRSRLSILLPWRSAPRPPTFGLALKDNRARALCA
jgi:hypothetical protein